MAKIYSKKTILCSFLLFLLGIMLVSFKSKAGTNCADNRGGSGYFGPCGCQRHGVNSCAGTCYVSTSFTYDYSTGDTNWDYCQGHKMSYVVTGYGSWTYVGDEGGMAKYERNSTASVSCAFCGYTSQGTLTEYDYREKHNHSKKVECVGTDRHLYYCGNSTHSGTTNACGYSGYYEAHTMSDWISDGSRYYRSCIICGYREYETALIYYNRGGDLSGGSTSSIQAYTNSMFVNMLDRADGYDYDYSAFASRFFGGSISISQMTYNIVESPEAKGKSWYGDADTWVRHLYRGMLHRDVDSSYTYWVNAINNGTCTRWQVAAQILKSSEFSAFWGVVYTNTWENSNPTVVSIPTHGGGYEKFGSFGGKSDDWERPKGYVVTGNYWYIPGTDKSFGNSQTYISVSGNTSVYIKWQRQSVDVTFYRNYSSEDYGYATETFYYGDSGNRFGYYPGGGGRYSPMNSAAVGFGSWSRSGYYLGEYPWAESRNGTGIYPTYCYVSDDWIASNCGGNAKANINLYLQWQAYPPSVSVIYRDSNGNVYTPGNWTPLTVTATALVDDGGSGHPTNYVSWDGGANYASSTSKSFASSGSYSGILKVINKAGLSAQVNWGTVMIDKTSPTVYVNGAGTGYVGSGNISYDWSNKAKNLYFSSKDAHSGMSSITLYSSGGAVLATGVDSISFSASNEGVQDYILKAKDRVGNETTITIQVKLDFKSPVYSAAISYKGKEDALTGDVPLSSVIGVDRDEYGSFEIVVKMNDEASGITASGLKDFYVVIGNLDNMQSRRYYASFNPGDLKGEVRIAVSDSDTLFMGELGVYVYARDRAGNMCEINENLGVFTLDAGATSLFTGDNEVFPLGSTGRLDFSVSGYACEVTVELPPEFCEESYPGEFEGNIPKQKFSYALGNGDFIHNGRAKGSSEFYIPLYMEEGSFSITVTAIKTGTEIIYNPILDCLETTSILTVSVPIEVYGSVLDDLRTSLR